MQLAYGWQMQFQGVCFEYIASIAYYYVALPVYGLTIQVTNTAISKTVLYAARWLKFKDVTSEAVFQMTFLYFMLVFNMTLPFLMVNLDLSHKAIVFDV